MQRVYWIRHAESDHSVHNDALRPLTARGLEGRHRVEGYLAGRAVGAVLSSPYRRAYDTVQPFAASRGLQVLCDDRFRERRVAGEREWIEDFFDFSPASGLTFPTTCQGESPSPRWRSGWWPGCKTPWPPTPGRSW